MALFCAETPLKEAEGHVFTETWNAGDRPVLAGIYRCACGGEVAVPEGGTLPAGAGHAHQKSQGVIVWRLILAAESSGVVALPARARPKAAWAGALTADSLA